jgi:hypothetical protein
MVPYAPAFRSAPAKAHNAGIKVLIANNIPGGSSFPVMVIWKTMKNLKKALTLFLLAGGALFGQVSIGIQIGAPRPHGSCA